MEKIGFEKRDLLISAVKKARGEQKETGAEFQDAMTQLKKLSSFHGGNLESGYDKFKAKYDDYEQQALRLDLAFVRWIRWHVIFSVNGSVKLASMRVQRWQQIVAVNCPRPNCGLISFRAHCTLRSRAWTQSCGSSATRCFI